MGTGKIKAGIVGGAGYTGGETIRLLLNHPGVELIFVQSRSQQGQSVSTVHKDLVGETDLIFTESMIAPVDVLFLCMGQGESAKLLDEKEIPSSTRIIDLGNDFRLGRIARGRSFVYGLPEFQRDAIRRSQNIANPGCFATTIQLGLLPLGKAGLLKEIHTTGITGSTGAGQKMQDVTHFTWRSNNISAYKTLQHQHTDEILQTINSLQPDFGKAFHFVPWRGDFTRGIFVTSVMECFISLDEVNALYQAYYQTHPFTFVSDQMIDIKQVVNSNKCLIYLEKVGNKLAIHSVTDNLLKGASGQAVQNMNLMFGLEETDGLRLKASAF